MIKQLSFADFAVNLFGKKIVEEYCISLQNKQNVNIVSLLWCVWLNNNKKTIFKKLVREVIKFCLQFEQQHIIPLRNKRTSLKGQDGYIDALNLEIQQEIKLMQQLSNKFNPLSKLKPPTEVRKDSIDLYEEITDVKINRKILL